MAGFFVPFFRVHSHYNSHFVSLQVFYSKNVSFVCLYNFEVIIVLDFGRIEQLVKENHKSLSFLSASVLGKYRTFLRDVRDHNGKITDEQVSALATALNTTPEYLKGETDIKEKTAPINEDGLSEKEIEFLKIFRQLSVEEQDLFLKMFHARQE